MKHELTPAKPKSGVALGSRCTFATQRNFKGRLKRGKACKYQELVCGNQMCPVLKRAKARKHVSAFLMRQSSLL